MRVVLVPSPRIEAAKPSSYVPLGIMTLITVLRKADIDASICDINAISQDPRYKSVARNIVSSSPDVIGFSTICATYQITIRIAKECKRLHPTVKILLGGPQASGTAYETLKTYNFIDAIALGESESRIVELVSCLMSCSLHMIKYGLAYRHNDDVIVKDVSASKCFTFGDIDYSVMPNIDRIEKSESVPVEVGRGCPSNCNYCSTSEFWHRSCLYRPVNEVINTITKLKEDYGFSRFSFIHDNFTSKVCSALELINGIKTANLDISWSVSCRLDAINESFIDQLSNAGCDRVFLGLESGSTKMQKHIGKNLCLDRAIEIVSYLTSSNIFVVTSFIIGFPEESEDDIVNTLSLMFEISYDVPGFVIAQYHPLTPLASTKWFHDFKSTMRYDDFRSDLTLSDTLMSTEDIDEVIEHPCVFPSFSYYPQKYLTRLSLIRISLLVEMLKGPLKKIGNQLWQDYREYLPKKLVEHCTKPGYDANMLPMVSDIAQVLNWSAQELSEMTDDPVFLDFSTKAKLEQQVAGIIANFQKRSVNNN